MAVRWPVRLGVFSDKSGSMEHYPGAMWESNFTSGLPVGRWIRLLAGALLPLGLACTAEVKAGNNAQNGSAGGAGVGGTTMPAASSIGQGVVRRLTHTEYNSTVQALFGTTLMPADAFPGDVGADGFDNASGPQTVVANHLTAFEDASTKLVDAAFFDPTQRARLVACDLTTGDACVRASLEAFLPRAWRRPVQPAEVDRLMALAATEALVGGSTEEQLKLALRGVLTSAHFMYRVELDPDPASPVPHPLSSYELASRLSYFLWSSMPDDELFAVAAQGTLQDDAVLGGQVARLLADPKGLAMAEVFAAQWLQLTKLPGHEPKADLFPTITLELKASMAQETKLFFQELLQSGGAISSLVGANHTFMNGALAQHYGLPAASADFARVSVEGTNRLGGVLGHASVLMLTSGLTKTSAVKRGAWVLDNLLCTPPPAPPADIMDEILAKQQEVEALDPNQTQREFLSKHRADPKCGACHKLIDPVGLAFENYDAVGRYRDMDHGVPIDAAGMLADGSAFQNARELAAIMAQNPSLAQCVAKKLFTFALGRTPGAEDEAHLQALTTSNADPLGRVLTKLVSSTPFRYRRGGQGAQ